ncbi:lipoate--protein ligase [Paucilactobacillus kaifaensis]|uniref:lipoate--protein ligase n=1 Tax=Paucilactobacillus kaifaensis TaxID=2559921 RepID=UPI0010F7A0CE|nr:lipoate--protein ligase [Paucilactobacillus kaifaensis]
MFLIDTTRNGKPVYDATINQSLDNYLVNDLRLPGHGLIVYINQPSVIIGVNQNAYDEVDLPYLKKHNISLVRRTSGGGAVYHDFGNIIFENIVIGDDGNFGNFHAIADPILEALHDFGATDAQMRGRNDMVVNDQKFSGMTMFKVGDSYAAGGTLMYDLNNEAANEVLTPEKDKLASKGVASVNSRVTNIKPFLKSEYQNWTTEEFKNALICHIFGVNDLSEIETYHLSDHDWKVIDQRLAGKYDTDQWNYGENPGYKEYRSKHFDIGTVAFNFTVSDGKVSQFKIYGDFITGGDISKIEKNLIGVNYDRQDLIVAFNEGQLEKNLGKVSAEELADLMLE